MPKVLTEDQVARFADDGFLFPFDVCSVAEAARMHAKFEQMEETLGEEPQVKFRIKAHLPFPWLCAVISHPRLLDAVEDIIGPNILCWGSSFFEKEARDPGFVSWHQDSTYYGIEPPDTLTAWLAISDSTLESGCVKFIPGSHDQGVYHHDETRAENNLLSRGQTIAGVAVDTAVAMELRAGQFSFHKEDTVHASEPNRSDDRRIGLSIHYVPPTLRDVKYPGASAMLLRGEDTHQYWARDPWPEKDWDPACLAVLDDVWRIYQSSAA